MVGRIICSPCMQCFSEAINRKLIPESVSYELLASDTGVISFLCKKGHKNSVLIQESSFEILLEFAVENIVDQYYREAVFNFAAAQERCFEFFIELITLENKINDSEYSSIWKKILKNSSERQLGAFYLLYLIRFQKNFNYDEDKV